MTQLFNTPYLSYEVLTKNKFLLQMGKNTNYNKNYEYYKVSKDKAQLNYKESGTYKCKLINTIFISFHHFEAVTDWRTGHSGSVIAVWFVNFKVCITFNFLDDERYWWLEYYGFLQWPVKYRNNKKIKGWMRRYKYTTDDVFICDSY